MKITVNSYTFEDDYRDYFSVTFDNEGRKEVVLEFCDGEPEDNSIARNFRDIYGIPDLIKQAFEAGKNGDTLEIEKIQQDPWD